MARAAAALDLLRRSPTPLRHAEVAQALDLPKSSTTNLLDTLVDAGLLGRDARGHSLGVKLIELGAVAAERLDLREIAQPVMRELAHLGIGTSNLAILVGHDIRYVEKLHNSEHLIQIATRVGGSLPAHTTALGKVLVAGLGTDQRQRWVADHHFSPLTERTIIRADRFERDLAFVEENGYALDEEESHLGTYCIAAPIEDHAGSTVAAISLTSLVSDPQAARDARVEAVVAGAGRVSRMLGGG